MRQRHYDRAAVGELLERRILLTSITGDAAAFEAGALSTQPVAVVNGSFEDISGETPINEFTFGPLNGWDLYDPGAVTDGGDGPNYFVGTLLPSEHFSEPGVTQNFPGGAPDGVRVGIAFNFEPTGDGGEYGLQQTLVATLEADTIYTLSVDIGNIATGIAQSGQTFFLDGFPGYRVELMAGGTVIATDDNSLAGTIPEGEFRTSEITFNPGSTHALLGQPLGIRLVNLNQSAGVPDGNDLEVDFDNVRLTSTANSPPAIGSFDTTVTYTANAPAVVLDFNATVTDDDTTRFGGGVLTISLTAGAEVTDRLEIRPITRLIGVSGANLTYRGTTIASFSGGTGTTDLVITFDANATQSAVQTVLRNVTFRSESATPSGVPRTAQVTLTDGAGGTSNLPTKTINITSGSALPGRAITGNALSANSNHTTPGMDTYELLTAEAFSHGAKLQLVQALAELALGTPDDARAGYLLAGYPTTDHGGYQLRQSCVTIASVAAQLIDQAHHRPLWQNVHEPRGWFTFLAIDDVFARFESWG